jgi:hypothetical protein
MAELDDEIERVEAEIIRRGKNLSWIKAIAATSWNESVVGNQSAGRNR